MKIAICSDISQFHQNQLRSRQWSQQFLGSAWVTSLYERQNEMGIEVASGDVALQKAKSGEWPVDNIYVIQELDARHGSELCRLGAIPAVLTIFESPLVAYRSIDRLLRSNVTFAHCIGPKEIFSQSPALRHSHHWQLSFPSYRHDQLPAPVPWSQRQHAVLVAANKYWNERKWPRANSAKDALRILRHGIRKLISPTYRSSRQWQLHDQRLDLMYVLGRDNKIDIFGKGWNNVSNMPLHHATRLSMIHSAFKGPCDDKHGLLARYKFTIAYENTAYPGYVTEKAIDAFVSSSIPVYLGAPDIETHLPSGAYINARAYKSPDTLVSYLEQLSEPEATKMIAAGKNFLGSLHGQRHTYEGFGEWVVSLVNEMNPNHER